MINPSMTRMNGHDGVGLNVATWPGARRGVVAVHGLTASHMAWQAIADALDGSWELVAMDRRGCGRSDKPTSPSDYGLNKTADDTAAVIRDLGFDQVVLVGHSYGAFSVQQTAVRHPDLVAGVIMVDGGFTVVPEGTDIPALARLVLGPALARTDATFASVEEFVAPLRDIASFRIAGEWNDYVQAYYEADLEGEPPTLRSSASPVMAMAEFEAMAAPSLHDDLEKVKVPFHLIRAERGLLLTGEEPQVVPDVFVDLLRQRVLQLTEETVADTNHYTVSLSERGGRAIAAAIEKMAGEVL